MSTIIPEPITVSNENRPKLLPRVEISHFGQDISFSDEKVTKASKDKFTKWADDYISFIKNSGVSVAYINIGDYSTDIGAKTPKFEYSYLDPSLGTEGVPWIVTEFLDKLPAGVEVGALPYLKAADAWTVYDENNFSGNTYTTDGKKGSPPKNNLYQAFELVNNINNAQLNAGGTKFITHFQADGEGAGDFEDDTYYGFGGEAKSKKSPYNPEQNKTTPESSWSWHGGTAKGWPKAGYGYTKWLFNHFMPGVDKTAASAADGSNPLKGSNVPNVVFSDAQAIQPETWSKADNPRPYQFGIIKYSQTSWLLHSPGPMKAYTENYWFGENNYRPGPGSSVAPDGTITINSKNVNILNGPDTDPLKTAPEVVFNKPTKGTAAQGYAVMGKGAISDFDKYTHAFFGSGLGEGYSTGVKIIDGGSGYSEGGKYNLNIKFSPPDDPNGRIATGFIDSVDSSGAISGITVKDPGEGYSKEPTVILPKTSGKTATATALITPENGYPQLVFPAPTEAGGIQAAGYATVNSQAYKAGQINGLVITEPGSGYLQHKLPASPDPLKGPNGGLKVIFKSESGSGAPPIYLPVNTGSGQIDHIVLTVLGDGYNAQDDQPFYTLTGDKTKHYLKGGINNNGIDPNYSGSYVPVLNRAGSFRVDEKTGLADISISDAGAGYSAGVIITNGGGGYDPNTDYPVKFSGGGGIEQATGLLEVNANGVATGVRITNPGRGYTAEPTMEIPGPAKGKAASGTVHLLNYPKLTVSGGSFKQGGGTPTVAYATTVKPDPKQAADPNTGYIIEGVHLSETGLGYSTPPTFTVSGNAESGRAARIEALPRLATKYSSNRLSTLSDLLHPLSDDWEGTIEGGANAFNYKIINGYGPGQVTKVDMTSVGSGYTEDPTVTFSAPSRTGGKTATGKAVLGTGETAGTVTSIEVIDAGYGYKKPPEITISNPTSGTVATTKVTIGDIYIRSPRVSDTNYSRYADHPEQLAEMFDNEYYQSESLPKLSEKFYWPINWNSFGTSTATDGTKTPQQAIATFNIESIDLSNVDPKDPKTPVKKVLDAKYHKDGDVLKLNPYGGTFAGLSSLTYENFVKFLNESATIIAEEAKKGGATMKPEDVTFQIYDAAFLPLEWLPKQNTNSWSLNDSDAVLDLTEIPATGSTLHFSITSDADHTNRFGLVKVDVDDLTGSYSVAGESVANTDSFREAVSDNLINPGDGSPITATGQTNRSISWDLSSSDAGLYAPVLINTDGEVFTIGASASDGNQHVKALGNNTFGFEDLLLSDLSDWDHNDFVVQVSLDPLS